MTKYYLTEIILPGFDGSTDATDDRVLWAAVSENASMDGWNSEVVGSDKEIDPYSPAVDVIVFS